MKVELIDHMGSDLSVVNAARVSFDKEADWELEPRSITVKAQYTPPLNSRDWDVGVQDVEETHTTYMKRLSDRDIKLINYLAKHNHWTPFGHISASFRIKAPIFVARQLGKHQVGLVWNEVSRRYVDDEPEFYVPTDWRKKAENVKQGSSSEIVGERVDIPYAFLIKEARDLYSRMIGLGVAPEQARMVLPQSMYTEWIWSGSVAAFARVVKLRLDPHTQLETQSIAMQIDAQLETQFPYSWKALTHG